MKCPREIATAYGIMAAQVILPFTDQRRISVIERRDNEWQLVPSRVPHPSARAIAGIEASDSAGHQHPQILNEPGAQGFGVLLSEVGEFCHSSYDIGRAHGTTV